MKYDRRTLVRRMRVRIAVYTALVFVCFTAMFFLYDNSFQENFDVFLIMLGMAIGLGLFMGIMGLIWEAIWGDEDLRQRKKGAE